MPSGSFDSAASLMARPIAPLYGHGLLPAHPARAKDEWHPGCAIDYVEKIKKRKSLLFEQTIFIRRTATADSLTRISIANREIPFGRHALPIVATDMAIEKNHIGRIRVNRGIGVVRIGHVASDKRHPASKAVRRRGPYCLVLGKRGRAKFKD